MTVSETETRVSDTPLGLGEKRRRALVAGVVAVVGTAALLLWLDSMPASANPLVTVTPEYVRPEIPYTKFNQAWLLVRGLLGLYISGVFVVIALQLLGTWRRLLEENGGGE